MEETLLSMTFMNTASSIFLLRNLRIMSLVTARVRFTSVFTSGEFRDHLFVKQGSPWGRFHHPVPQPLEVRQNFLDAVRRGEFGESFHRIHVSGHQPQPGYKRLL